MTAIEISDEDAQRAAQLLVTARRGGALPADLPAALCPTTLEQAYAIQDAAIRRLGGIGAWKVGPHRGGNDPTCSPIARDMIHTAPAAVRITQTSDVGIEVEIAVSLARDLPPRATVYAPEDLRSAIAAVHPAVEILGSRFENLKAVSALSAVADSQSNAGIVIGPGLSNWQDLNFGTVAMELRIGGESAGTTSGGTDTAAVLSALAWLANHAVARNGGLKAGDVIITGARLGPAWIGRRAARVEAEVHGLGKIEIAINQ